MATLWPRVGKKKMHDINRAGGEQILNGIYRLDAEDANVADILSSGLTTSRSYPAEKTLDAEKIALRKFLRERDKKSSVTATKIDLERSAPRENIREIEWRKVICR